MSAKVETLQHRIMLLENREYMKTPLTTGELEIVEYDYNKLGMTAPENIQEVIAKVEYEEPVIRAMTLQPTIGKTTIVDGYSIEETAKSNYNTKAMIGTTRPATGGEMTGSTITREVVQDKVTTAQKNREEENKKG